MHLWGRNNGVCVAKSCLVYRGRPIQKEAKMSLTLSLNSSSALWLVFSQSMVTFPPSSIVMVPYKIPERKKKTTMKGLS